MTDANKEQSNEQTEPMENVQELFLSAQQGDAEAQFKLGRAYYNGEGVAQDYKQAKKWWKTAAEQGHIDAQYQLGKLYYDVTQDYKQAAEWYRKAAEQGHVDAQTWLGKLYYSQGYKPAFEWFKKAAEQGNAEAQTWLGKAYYRLGIQYYFGHGVTQDYKQAFEWFRKAANQGDADGQYWLGNLYASGNGVAQDKKQAVELYRKAGKQGNKIALIDLIFVDHPIDDKEHEFWKITAAEQGHAFAQCILANEYSEKKDYEKATYWWEKAAEQGDKQGQFSLGVACYQGKGIAQNEERAVRLWKEVAKHGGFGVVRAEYNLGSAYYEGKGVAQDKKQAIKWWENAAKTAKMDELGLPEAQNSLGIAYYFGQGFAHHKRAIQWWLKAAKQELISAQCYLAFAYKKGQDVKKDEKKSLYWIQKAAANTVSKVKIEPDLNQVKEKHLLIFLSEEAKAGITPAQVILAYFYEMGTEVKQDRQQAFFWMEKAAQDKDLIAQYHLGMMYMEGQGVAAKNMEKAREQFQRIVKIVKELLTNLINHERDIFDYRIAGEGRVSHRNDTTDYSRDIKQLIGLLAQDKLLVIHEKAAKQELEDVMAMFAHKFRGPLQSIQYNAEHSNQKQITLQAVQTMAGLLNIFSTIATDAQQLRHKLQQDMQGDGTLVTVLEKAMLPVIKQVLTIDNAKKIRQHYLGYAKKTGQVPTTTTRKQWVEDYFQLEEQLQIAWEESFSALLTEPRLEQLVAWIEERFFPLEVIGFHDKTINFERYGATESTLIIVMTEMLLNAVKYYSSKTNDPVRLSWQHDKTFCTLVCENPSSRDERRIDKGSQKGHKFLNIIARNLQGNFPEPLPKNPYQVKWQIPMDLLVKE